MRATYSPSTRGMHHMSLRQGLRWFSASRRRTVSCDRLSWSVSLTISPANSSNVQRARPAGGLGGGCHQKGFLLAGELALRSRTWLFGERPFEIALHEAPLGAIDGRASHHHGASNLLIATADIGGQQDLGSLELAGGMLACAQHRSELIAFGLAQLDPITYIHLGLLVGSPDESTDESKIGRVPPLQPATFHGKARRVSSLHLCLFAHVPAPTRRNRHATLLPRQPPLRSPNGPHPRARRPDSPSARHRPKHRTPRPPRRTPHSQMAQNQPVKSSVTRY